MTRNKLLSVTAAAVVVTACLLLFLFVGGEDLDTSRSRASVLLLTLLSQRKAVEMYVRSHRTLAGAGSVVEAKGDPKYRQGANQIIVSDDATMIAVNNERRVMLVLMPKAVGEKVSWRCVVVPQTATPSPCREDGEFQDWLNRQ